MATKATLVLSLVIVMVLMQVAPVYNGQNPQASLSVLSSGSTDGFEAADAGGAGSSTISALFASVTLPNLQLSVLNTYANTSRHTGIISLGSYQVPGWSLYRIVLQVKNITAAPERRVVGVSPDTWQQVRIYEYDPGNGYRYNSLAQGFYLRPQVGRLLNYSFYYDTPTYAPALHGWAFYSVLTDYQNAASNITSYTGLPTHALTGPGWETKAALCLLSANTQYYITINGSALIKTTNYPDIQWYAQNGAGTFNTRRFSTESGTWGASPLSYEALLNYTYQPWNSTASKPLLFNDPPATSLKVNQTSVSGNEWSFTGNSISSLKIYTNQSVFLNHNMTLYYKRSVPATCAWKALASGNDVTWNVTFTASYPSAFTLGSKFVNISKMSDWAILGLYNGTPSSDYGHYTYNATTVYCTLMTNGTWTLKNTAFNYLTLITTKESGSGQPLSKIVSILTDVTIESSVQDLLGNPATSGTTNITIWHSGSRIWAPTNASVVAGKSSYLWDISSTTTNNGPHIMEVLWSNGTEAGYLSKQLVVYYPTSLAADDYVIDALSDDSFFVRINYDNAFTPKGLNSTYAAVRYSFNNEANVSMNDGYNNGTWTKTVSTMGRSNGAYLMKVYAEGYALQNQSITITVNLVHETQQLSPSWTSNTIDWTQTVILSISYRDSYGSLIPDATQKDLYINGTLYSLKGTNGTYWIQVNNTFGLGHHVVFANISKDGYRPRTLGGITFDTNQAATGLTVSWQPINMTITYTQLLNLTAHYTYGGSDVPPSAIVNVTISGHTYSLTYSAGAWRVSIPGKDIGLGLYSATTQASLYGYQYQTASTSGLNVTAASNTLISVATSTTIGGYSSSVLYNDGWVIVQVRIQDMGSNPITLGSVNLTIEAHTYTLTLQPSDNYTLTLQARYFGVGPHSGTIHVHAYGYQEKTTPLSIVVARVPSHINVSQGQVPSVMYLNQTCVFVLEYIDNHTGSAIPGASVAYFLWPNGITESEISPGTYRVTISSSMLSLTSHLFNVTLGHDNFTTAGLQRYIMIRSVYTHLTTPTSFPQYQNETVFIWANFTDSDHGQLIHWASVNATIDGVIYQMTYSGHGIYGVSFRITMLPNTYVVTINALAAGCSSNMTTTNLLVQAKEFVYINLDFVGSPVEGNSITIRAIIRHNVLDTPIVGALVQFEVVTVYVNGSRQTFSEAYLTSSTGEASWAFNIPVGTSSSVDHLEVNATYHGTTSIWAANNALQIKVTLGPLALLFLFLTSTNGLLVMALIIGAAVAVTVNEKKRKPKIVAARSSLEHQIQDFNDLGTLRHFIAIYLNRGTCVFYHPFGESRIQADLISGFISAITSVYGEIKGNGVQGTLEEIHYHGLRLNSYSGKFVIGILILEGELTPLVKDRLQYFVDRFEDQYQDNLRDWNGENECFDPEWIVSNLVAAFNFNWLLPHKLSAQKKMSGDQKKILRILGTRLDEKGEFLISDVLSPIAEATGRTEPEALDYLLKMEEKSLIIPISISTVLQRQGMALVDKEACAAGEEPVSPGVVVVVHPKTEEEPGPRERSARIEAKPTRTSGKPQASLAEKAPRKDETEASLEAVSEHIQLKPEEQFLAEVEKLLMADREKKHEALQTKEKKQRDEADNFVEDVEKTLSSNKEHDEG